MKLLIASHNIAKVQEYKRYLKNLPLEIVSLTDLNINQEAPEDGKTFKENAINKAKFYNNLTGLPSIADDGGLMIDALNGEPGVRSRRWLGYKMTDEEMIDSVLEKMKDVPDEKRSCSLAGVIALVSSLGTFTQFAEIKGVVAKSPSAKRLKGYPFRSFFFIPKLKKFYIDLSQKEHELVNHRKFALLKLKPYLLKLVK